MILISLPRIGIVRLLFVNNNLIIKLTFSAKPYNLHACLKPVRSHDAIFHPNFKRLAQVSRLESIVEVIARYDFTIDFRLIKHIQNFWFTEKVILVFSPESRLKIGRTSDFQSTFKLCFRLSSYMDKRYDFSRKRIR